ncbi:MAG: tRNA (adenosine(37)-N6)-threonylcarbamoyltransferase complex dimerization subunit type 1 TsaB [Burkholderiales bacterium]|nr:tRNA (adenosine(37)-N6)-threonylcarbamoyltransferase complex dimerization subunit type 1 TsaB [Burkholderiales bacterium]
MTSSFDFRLNPDAPVAPPVLALATSGPWCSVGLRWHDRAAGPAGALRTACASEPAGQTHSQRLLPMAHALLAQAGLTLADVGLIGFDAGPGSFTGLRIGCGLAQGLALGIGCPVVAVSGLQALAWVHRGCAVISATDARMGEVYFASWPAAPALVGDAPVEGGLAVGPPSRLEAVMAAFAAEHSKPDDHRPADAVRPATGNRIAPQDKGSDGWVGWVAAGDAFLRYPALAEQALALGASVFPTDFPRGDVIAELAHRAWSHGLAVPPDQVAPFYVRDKVALDVDEQRALRAARDSAR